MESKEQILDRIEEIIVEENLVVPVGRRRDVGWLSRNLGIQNREIPDELSCLIRALLKREKRS